MIAKKKKICKECQTEQYIWGKGLCKRCYPHKKYVYKKEPTGELAVFKEIYEERPDICEWCGVPITGFSVMNYHHVKHKSTHPELRLDKNNITKICVQCHIKAHQ